MPRLSQVFILLPLLFAVSSASALHAQTAVPPRQLDPFKDTAPVRAALQPGEKVVIYEFEDMECPACAAAYPVVHRAVDRFHLRLVRHDFPLPIHTWSRTAATTARYLQDRVSPDVAEQFRRDVFAHQAAIDSPDDLAAYTRRWLDTHHIPPPPSLGPDTPYAQEVQADIDLGKQIGLRHTPTIFVVNPAGWVEVVDVAQLDRVIQQAEAGKPPTANHGSVHRPR